MSDKSHWERVFRTKSPEEVSWTQAVPETSIRLIEQLKLPESARVIDIGGGDSRLVDFLQTKEYLDLTVLDISEAALERARLRLGANAESVEWIVSDVRDFFPTKSFDLWHDRAAYHFLTSPDDQAGYLSLARKWIKLGGYLILGTFSTDGPKKCSGLEISQYDESALTAAFEDGFQKIECLTEDHQTPFGTFQNFLFCTFRRVDLD